MTPMVQESFRAEWMEALLDDPEVFQGVSGGEYRREEFNLGLVPKGTQFFGVFSGEQPIGFFTVLPGPGTRVEIHTTMGKTARGKVAIDAMRSVLSLLKQKGVTAVGSFCYKKSPHTIWFAKKCGFHVADSPTDSNLVPVEICLSPPQ